MSFTSYPNGAGGITGDQIAVNKPLYVGTGGHVWYVKSATGIDSGARGKERELPLATFNQAFTNASAGDVVILMEGHAETIAANIAVNKALTIVGEGSGTTRPRLTSAVAGGTMLTMSATGSSLNNIYFPAGTAGPTTKVQFTAAGIVSDNCYFECGPNESVAAFTFGAGSNSCQLTNAYFLSTASQPNIAVLANNAISGLFMENVTFDGGSFGFSDFAFKSTAVLTAIYANQIHQLNNADITLAAGWTGVWNVGNTSASARFEG